MQTQGKTSRHQKPIIGLYGLPLVVKNPLLRESSMDTSECHYHYTTCVDSYHFLSPHQDS
jgi:hypothetical protein